MSILSNRLVYLMMTIVVIFWGVSWPIGSIVAGEFGPNVFTAAFIRFSIALPALFLIVKLKEGSLSIPRDLHRNVALLGFMQITLYNFMYLSGLRFTSSSDASLIIAINPTLTALFASRIYEDERFSVKRVIGLIFAFSGVLLIFLESPNEAVPNRLLGNTLIFMGALIWSLYTTFS
ncbi:MAG: DMT family transporter, partial [Candidatus Kariarchaeaceae archaeon]